MKIGILILKIPPIAELIEAGVNGIIRIIVK